MNWGTIISSDTILVIITALVTFFSTKRKYKAESAGLELKNYQTIFETYRSELEYMKNRMNDLESTVEKQNKVIKLLQNDLDEFEKKFGKQTKTRKKIENDETDK